MEPPWRVPGRGPGPPSARSRAGARGSVCAFKAAQSLHVDTHWKIRKDISPTSVSPARYHLAALQDFDKQ